MLTPRLNQIKERLEERNSSTVLTKEEFELLKELTFLESNEEIQTQIILNSGRRKLFEMIAPAPDKCPACGRKF
ncbi:hypothetical protein [Flavobacterium sp.]|uniref:hypothetical protein n=1 Tax=Flavobacterium sp. TaxID=239 RepID=UPI004048B4D7